VVSPAWRRPGWRHAIVIEVQLGVDEAKRFTWPLYVTALRARERVPVTLLVVARDAGVAAWAETPIAIDDDRFVFAPLVLGPARVPVVTTPEQASDHPELTVLSILAHGKDADGVAVARVLVHAFERLDAHKGRFYYDLVLEAMNAAAKHALETTMANLDWTKNYEWQSDWAKGHRAAGRVEALTGTLRAVLQARGLGLTEAQTTRITSCTDADQLDQWIVRAVTAASADDVFAST
jgi:hypothetical protein